MYYELVMGSACEVRGIDEFVNDFTQQGVLDYGAVLDNLARTYGATRVTALDFEQRDVPIVQRLFDAVLPGLDLVEDSEKLVNVSLSVPELVRAKRYLNGALGRATLDLRLDAAERIKEQVGVQVEKKRAKVAPGALTLSVEDAIIANFAKGSRTLSQNYLSDLKLLQPDRGPADLHLNDALVTEWISLGLTEIVTSLERLEKRDKTTQFLGMSASEMRLFLDTISTSRVTVILGWPDAALVAACFTGHLVFATLPSVALGFQLSLRIDQTDLPSPVITSRLSPVAEGETQLARDYVAIWEKPYFRQADCVIIGRGLPADSIFAWLAERNQPLDVLVCSVGDLVECLPLDKITHIQKQGGMVQFRLNGIPQYSLGMPASFVPSLPTA